MNPIEEIYQTYVAIAPLDAKQPNVNVENEGLLAVPDVTQSRIVKIKTSVQIRISMYMAHFGSGGASPRASYNNALDTTAKLCST